MTQATDSPRNCATVWFVRLERARLCSDYEAAAEAIRELKRLGVVIKFEAPQECEVASQ